jgi:hypothetical protein
MVIAERTAKANLVFLALNDMLLMVSKGSYTVKKAFVEGRKEIGWLLEEASIYADTACQSWLDASKREIEKTNSSASSRL